MTIRFAAAKGGTTPAIVRALCPSAPLSAANDNRRAFPRSLRPDETDRAARIAYAAAADGDLLAETLRHFARHGLAAAAQARSEAEAASASGDRAARDRWIAICRQLDRRMADACARKLMRKA